MNALDFDHCYQALCSRDRRFDGQFFVAVSSTGIYCRPVCPARTPKPENCQFFRHSSAAEDAGYRPCLRCRPELAPGLSTLELPDQLLAAACRLIQGGYLHQHSLADLAARLGITDRHLRRLFRSYWGVSPSQCVQNMKLLQAKQLLTDTRLPISDVAAMSGFGSSRRLHSLFQERYRLTPGQLRQQSTPTNSDTHTLYLSYRPPLDSEALLAFLANRSIAGVEQVSEQHYRRTVQLTDNLGQQHNGWLELTPEPDRHRVCLRLSNSLGAVLPELQRRVRRLLDLDCDPQLVNQHLGGLAADRPGLRLPGSFDGFEMSVRAILGQQVTVKAAHTLAGRVAAQFGTPLDTPWPELAFSFPDAVTLAALEPAQLGELGIIRQRAGAIIALAHQVAAGTIDLSPLAPVELTQQQLQALPGIGPWTAQYITMRALAWPDAFPDSDLGVIKALGSRNKREILARAEAWRPWRSYAVMHLWHGGTPHLSSSATGME